MTIWTAIRLRVQELDADRLLGPRLDVLEEAGADEIECEGWLNVAQMLPENDVWKYRVRAVPDLRLRGRPLRGWFEGTIDERRLYRFTLDAARIRVAETLSWDFELQDYATYDALLAEAAYPPKRAK